ncbi:gliding motility lipoprotein GldB [Flavobacteriaceae bacterium S356]|uniref:Gliding motility lipoprotein GldB n=1 Tax=Asprobacillus argus TaxID=3076534 RepID=A0ABU3LH53_9FLAO|nr:gliding motility lipoprotein GldB [Flavobacteriaceae bacterium S356]
MAIFFMITLLFSCKNETVSVVDVSHINVEIGVQRFEVDFYNTTKKTLSDTKEKYPMFFPANTSDSLWLKKISDRDERELYQETLKKYVSLESLEEQLTSLFKHIKYYNKSFVVPKITTVISNIDYDYRIIYNKASLIISLDCYLGSEHPFYGDYPRYIRENNTEDHIVVDVAEKIVSRQLSPHANDRSFLGKMIEEGKKMYVLDRYLPTVSDREKIGYPRDKYEWAADNEEQVWKYFLGKNLLYSTDTKLNKQFLDNAPFSKFYLSQDNLSPGRIGVFMGWQIVRSFMKNNDVTLQELLQIKPQDLFLRSKYKPNR